MSVLEQAGHSRTLLDLPNGVHPFNSGISVEDAGNNAGPSRLLQKLRRSQSFRCLSNESSPSDVDSNCSDSIYNAEFIRRFEDLVPLDITVRAGLRLEDTQVGPLPIRIPINSHCRWRPANLEPIPELSVSTIRRSASLSGLRLDHELDSHFAEPQAASQGKDASHAPENCDSFPIRGQRTKSFSLNDLDCFPRSDTNQVFYPRAGYLDPSSADILRSIPNRPASPSKPCFSPPYRIPTPPDLPSFGTEDALRLRFRSSKRARVRACIGELLAMHTKTGVGRTARRPRPVFVNPRSSGGITRMAHTPSDMLRRAIGLTSIVQIPHPSIQQRAPLPRGLKRSRRRGPLAVAPDGTWVVGTGYVVESGHGLDGRGPNDYRLVHAADPNAFHAMGEDPDRRYASSSEAGGHDRHNISTSSSTSEGSERNESRPSSHEVHQQEPDIGRCADDGRGTSMADKLPRSPEHQRLTRGETPSVSQIPAEQSTMSGPVQYGLPGTVTARVMRITPVSVSTRSRGGNTCETGQPPLQNDKSPEPTKGRWSDMYKIGCKCLC